MKNDIDYPATHSLDTNWFAIDQNGEVAVFDCGSEGSCPQVYRLDGKFTLEPNSWWDTFEKELPEIEPGILYIQLDKMALKRIVHRCTVKNIEKQTRRKNFYFHGFLLLKEGLTLGEVFRNPKLDSITLKLDRELPLYYASPYDLCDSIDDSKQIETLNHAMDTGELLGGFDIVDEDRFELMGFHYYECENWGRPIHGFKRTMFPKNATNIHHTLNPDESKIFRFDSIAFAKKEYVQPMLYAPCDYFNFKDEDIATGKVEVYISETETAFVNTPPDIDLD
jgi:hypothetical protein